MSAVCVLVRLQDLCLTLQASKRFKIVFTRRARLAPIGFHSSTVASDTAGDAVGTVMKPR